MVARQLTKPVRVAIKMVVAELKAFGIYEHELVDKKRHIQVRWDGGSVAISGTPSDRKALVALRASVRKQCKGTCGTLNGHIR